MKQRPFTRVMNFVASLAMLGMASIWGYAVLYGIENGATAYDLSAGIALVIASLFCFGVALYDSITGRL